MKIRINRIVKFTTVEGFGKRYCIWVQGCSIQCNGCANKLLWSKHGGKEYETSEIINDISSQKDNIEGVTFLGGEPFEQAEALVEISKEIRKKGYSIITFTGYTYEKLCLNDDRYIRALINNTDLLIDGPFELKKTNFSRPWVGSTNQKYIFLTQRYKKYEDKMDKIKNKFEINIQRNGQVLINGMGDFNKIVEQLNSEFIK
ncbi:radical SAM protein [Clostridium estertheticum]|uniref:4Fe-4S single cluster domain-containing protein n=1 Tax=Clostridium estertheticum TaxID=238834 RepID=UPI001C7CA38F|nr:4Fe-4S single cluster domain-containing protein [Clostridium estertheticum]MBX4261306.1 radical SAM protein [Clostridium estertheticum]WLC71657.1 radical SAM protein [Clostridium estertheticum]